MYKVSITNTNPAIGAKCRTATFTERDDAVSQFEKWFEWLDAQTDDTASTPERKVATTAFDYVITLEPIHPVTNAEVEDYDTHS